jgi:hypothetical protein
MIDFVRLARQLPNALVVVAAIDFIKNAIFVWHYWQANQFDGSSYIEGVRLAFTLGLIERGLGLLLYPLGWIVSAAMLHLLLAIYDRKAANNA